MGYLRSQIFHQLLAVFKSVDELAEESHSMRDIAYDSDEEESRFKSGSVNVITISLPKT